jgi:hypothetical protein
VFVSSRGGAALLCSALLGSTILAPAPAIAKDPPPERPTCTPLIDGVAFCPAEGNPYPDGITFITEGDQQATITLEPGVAIAPPDAQFGFFASTRDGDLVVNGSEASIATTGAAPMIVFSDRGDVTASIGSVAMTGDHITGLTARSNEGDVAVTAGEVATAGEYAWGIEVYAGQGNVAVTAGTVTTVGAVADAITAVADLGTVTVDAETISTAGDFAWGVNSSSGGSASIAVGSISVSGHHVIGVNTISLGTTAIEVGSVTVAGTSSQAVAALGIDAITIEAGTISVTGAGSSGIGAGALTGDINVTAGGVTTSDGSGVGVFTEDGNAFISTGDVSVAGEQAVGVSAGSGSGNVTIATGDVSTNGVFAFAVNADARGAIAISTGSVSTQGELAMAVRAFGGTTSITLGGPVSTTGESAFGVLTSSRFGDAAVRSDSAISTQGDDALALWVTGRNGTADIRATGPIATSGQRALGIRATGEDGAVSIVAGSVTTTGAASDGIEAETRFLEFVPFLTGGDVPAQQLPFNADISIRSEKVVVTGAGSRGINAFGLGNIAVDASETHSRTSNAVLVDANQLASLNVRGATSSGRDDAVSLTGSDVALSVAAGGSIVGERHAVLIHALGPREIEIPGGGPLPEIEPAAVASPGRATVTNGGTIRGGSGYALMVASGTATVTNGGTIAGAVSFADGDDRIDNGGLFDALKDSDFGAGSDLFVNSGTLRAASATIALLGLERFENSGRIDLANGVAGDSLVLPGAYGGAGGATLVLDASLSRRTADQLLVAGAATGSTAILLDVAPAEALLTGSAPLGLVTVGPGSSAGAFFLAPQSRDIGLVRLGLVYEPSAQRFAVASGAGAPVYRLLNLPEAAASAWHRSADVWSARNAAMRDGGSSSAGGLWGQLYGALASAQRWHIAPDPGGGTFDVDLSHRQDFFGGQLGLDLLGSGPGLRAGLTAGYQSSRVAAAGSDRTRFASVNAGAYATFASGPFFANALFKADLHSATASSSALGWSDEFDGRTYGAELEAGVRTGGGAFFFEPVAGLSVLRGDLGALAILGQSAEIDAADRVRGRLGLRAGGRQALPGGGALVFHAGAAAVHDFAAQRALTFRSGGAEQRLLVEHDRSFGEVRLGLSILSAAGLHGFVEAHGELGEDHSGGGGRLGLRVPF